MFTKSRQLIRIGWPDESIFVEVPGYLYHYGPYGIDVFIHHKVMRHKVMPLNGSVYYLHSVWVASDPSTGLALTNSTPARNRNEAVLALQERLSTVTLRQYNGAVWDWLKKSPPHKPKWRFNTVKGIAVEIEDEKA